MTGTVLARKALPVFIFFFSTGLFAHSLLRFSPEPIRRTLWGAPVSVRVGVADVHAYKMSHERMDTIVSVYTPTSLNSRTTILDFQFFGVRTQFPRQFVMSGGGDSDIFYYVDWRPGSILRRHIASYVRVLRNAHRSSRSSWTDFVVKALKNQWYFDSHLYLPFEVPAGLRVTQHMGADAEALLRNFLSRPFTGPNPLISRNSRETLSFMAALDADRTRLCFEKSWLASLVLKQAGINNRIRYGQMAFYQPNSGPKNGHTIVELADGRIFDPEWDFFGRKIRHSRERSWIRIDSEAPNAPVLWWDPYKHFPALVIEE